MNYNDYQSIVGFIGSLSKHHPGAGAFTSMIKGVCLRLQNNQLAIIHYLFNYLTGE